MISGLEMIREFKRRAEAALPGRVARVVLFGSRARGEAQDDSDWDVAIFLTDVPQTEDRRALADAAYDLILDSGHFIQPVALPLRRVGEESLFLQRIRLEGVAV